MIIINAIHKDKRPINTYEVDIKKVVLSKKESYCNKDSFKFFTGYMHKGDAFPAPLCIKLSQMNKYSKCFHKNSKCMNLLVDDKKNPEKYNKI